MTPFACRHRDERMIQPGQRDCTGQEVDYRCSHPKMNAMRIEFCRPLPCPTAPKLEHVLVAVCSGCPFREPPEGSPKDPLPPAPPERPGQVARLRAIQPRFVRTAELVNAALAMIPQFVRRGVARVAGVPRSGMIAAAPVAAHMGLPLYECTKEGRLVPLGSGHRAVSQQDGATLVIDDTVYGGIQATAIRQRIGTPILFAAVFATDQGRAACDLIGERLPTPHLLEWNLFNAGQLGGRCIDEALAGGFALDLDGLLCANPTRADAADAASLAAFARWCESAPATPWRPVTTEIPLILTARLSRFREPTERWLSAQGIRYRELVMHPARVPSERGDPAPWKANELRRRGLRWYVDSDPGPGQAVSREWPEGVVVDVASGSVWRGGVSV